MREADRFRRGDRHLSERVSARPRRDSAAAANPAAAAVGGTGKRSEAPVATAVGPGPPTAAIATPIGRTGETLPTRALGRHHLQPRPIFDPPRPMRFG